MPIYTKRLQVLLSPYMWDRLRALAQERRTSVAELVRDAVKRTYFSDYAASTPLDAVRRLEGMGLPVSDWEQMEMESGVFEAKHPAGFTGRRIASLDADER